MSTSTRFTVIFLAFTVLIWISLAFVAFWAYKSRQFSDQDRARYLALRSGPPLDEKAPEIPLVPQQIREGGHKEPDSQGRDDHHVSS